MKKVFIVVFIAGVLLAQNTWRRPGDSQGINPQYDTFFLVRSDSTEQTTRLIKNITKEDSVWTQYFTTRAYMAIHNTVDYDSCSLSYELWQSTQIDSASFFYVKTLEWSKGATVMADSVTADGVWYCDVNNYGYAFQPVPYSRILIRGLRTHQLDAGGTTKLEMSSPPPKEVGY